MRDYESAVIARGLHNGETATIKCIKFDDNQEIQVLLNDEKNLDIELELYYLLMKNSEIGERSTHSYNPRVGTIESYWLALHKIDYFDSEPEIEIIGEVDTLGSPYDETNDSSIVY